MNKRVAILGGTGFVGCHLARLLTQRGREVVLFDRAPPNRMGRHILAVPPGNVEFVEGDISVPTEVAGLLRRGPFHAVVNLAALQMLDWCNAHPLATYEVNVRGPLVLCDLAGAWFTSVPRVPWSGPRPNGSMSAIRHSTSSSAIRRVTTAPRRR